MEWKTFDEEKPKIGETILIYGPQTDLYFILSSLKYEGKINSAVTHWSYIPDQPDSSKREDMDGPSHFPDKGWTVKNAGFP